MSVPTRLTLNRRRFVARLGSLGLGSTLLPGALAAVAQDAEVITVERTTAFHRQHPSL